MDILGNILESVSANLSSKHCSFRQDPMKLPLIPEHQWKCRNAPGVAPLTKKREDSGYEIGDDVISSVINLGAHPFRILLGSQKLPCLFSASLPLQIKEIKGEGMIAGYSRPELWWREHKRMTELTTQLAFVPNGTRPSFGGLEGLVGLEGHDGRFLSIPVDFLVDVGKRLMSAIMNAIMPRNMSEAREVGTYNLQEYGRYCDIILCLMTFMVCF